MQYLTKYYSPFYGDKICHRGATLWQNPITQSYHYNLLIFLNFIQTSTLNLSPLYIKYNIVLLAKYQYNLHHLSFKSLHIK